jgi:endonuclease/exonuclease/phosphatase family metal-dependent hydrolase
MPALRIMSYNVRYFGHGTRGLGATEAGVRRIAGGIAALHPLPDFVCLQEVETRSLRSSVFGRASLAHCPTQLDMLMAELDAALAARRSRRRYVAHYFPAHTYRLTRETNFYTTGLAILALDDFKILGHNAAEPHDITHRTNLVRLKQTRICAHVAFEDRAGQRMELFNTHLSLPSFFAREFWTNPSRLGFGKNQLEEARVLASFVATQRKCDHFVIVGDFNSLPGSPVDRFFQEACGLRSAFAAHGLAHAHAHPHAHHFATAGFMNLRMHIDHLYASPSVEWIDLEGTHGFDTHGMFRGLSDHVPLIARCGFEPEPADRVTG